MRKVVIVIVLLSGTIAFLYVASVKMEVETLRAWAILATVIILPSFIGGLIIGNLEARGKIKGIDIAMDKIGSTYDHATRTVANLERKRPQPQPPTVQIYNATNDGLPPISHRRLTDSDEIVDL
jgi:hypothetical protein